MGEIERWRKPYLTGKCFDFALALALVERIAEPKFVVIGTPKWPEHVALLVGDELYADVRGVLGRTAFLAHHLDGEDAIQPITRGDIEFQCGLSGCVSPYRGNRDIAEARKAVKAAYPAGLAAAVMAAREQRIEDAGPTPPTCGR